MPVSLLHVMALTWWTLWGRWAWEGEMQQDRTSRKRLGQELEISPRMWKHKRRSARGDDTGPQERCAVLWLWQQYGPCQAHALGLNKGIPWACLRGISGNFLRARKMDRPRVRWQLRSRDKILNTKLRGKQKEFVPVLLMEGMKHHCKVDCMLLDSVDLTAWLPL